MHEHTMDYSCIVEQSFPIPEQSLNGDKNIDCGIDCYGKHHKRNICIIIDSIA